MLRRELEYVDMTLGQVLYEAGHTLIDVYFPATAIGSLLYVMKNGESAEIAVVGNDGVVGVSLFMGGGSTTSHALVRLMTQMVQTAACNRHHSLDQQFRRWLLLSLDRLQSTEMRMTPKLIAHMLGVTLEVATQRALKLQAAGLIEYKDGRIRVRGRLALEKRSCESYAVVKREYDRLLPLPLAA